ncbi:cytochrome ubiquinol oxidase subunit I [Acidianus sp. DSM 29099]|nr:cytochrome ubiquinol oxidase subunit I [Acidianus sp. RZ1]
MVDIFLFDRILAAYTMASHMLFTYWAISLPFFIIAAEYLGYKKSDPYYLALAKRFSVVMAVLFAVGSALGAAIAVEFITAWYKWMFLVNEIDILPFELEVMAFFSELIFLSLYLYGWDKMSRTAHMVLGGLVGLGSSMSAVLIVLVNSWMNTPNGFNLQTYIQAGQLTNVNPLAVLWPPAASAEIPMVLAGAWFVGFSSLIGYFSFRKIFGKNLDTHSKEYYNRGLKLASYLAALDAILLGWAGDNAGKVLYNVQPLKLATLEGVMKTQASAPMIVGPIKIPGLLSWLSTWNPNAVVLGYSSFASDVQDPIWWLSHDAYDLHATLGILGALVVWILAASYLSSRFGEAFSWLGLNNPAENKLPLYASFLIGWLQLIAWESGWVAAETGRQPFVIWGPMVQTAGGLYTIQGVLLTSDAFNTNPDVFGIGIAIMTAIAIAVIGTIYVLKKLFSKRDIKQDVTSVSVSTPAFSTASHISKQNDIVSSKTISDVKKKEGERI